MFKVTDFKLHCSAIHNAMTDVPKFDIEELEAAEKKAADMKEIAIQKGTETAKKKWEAAQKSVFVLERKKENQRIISVGAETICKAWYLDQWFNRQPLHASSKYTRKGTEVEWEAINLLNEYRKHWQPRPRYSKNPTTFENDFLIGTPDIKEPNLIIDTKCPYSHSTFPTLENELNPLYYDQMQGYMDLTGIKQAEVVYCLVNAPKKAIEAEAWNYAKTYNEGELTPGILAQFTAQMTYNDVSIEKRIKIFTVDYDPARIEAIKQRVLDCRAYLSTLI